MAAKQMRIRLEFSDPALKLKFGYPPESCWMLIDPNVVPNIQLLKQNIVFRFLEERNKYPEIDLRLVGGLLPDFESIQVLREDDVVKVSSAPESQKHNHPPANSSSQCNQSTSENHSKPPAIVLSQCEPGTTENRSDSPAKDTSPHLQELVPAHTNKKKKQNKTQTDISASTFEKQIPESIPIKQKRVSNVHKMSLDSESVLETPHSRAESNAETEISLLVSSDQNTSKNTSFSEDPVKRKRKRIRKRKKHSPVAAADEVGNGIDLHKSEKRVKTAWDENTSTPSASNKSTHLHFTYDDEVMILDDEAENDTGKVVKGEVANTTVKKVSNGDLRVQPTILPPTNIQYEERCNELLRRATTESQENTSVVLINCARNGDSSDTSSVPICVRTEKEYQSLPSLIGPPKIGDVIAYKILELSEKFIPELSPYKEAVVMEVDNRDDVLTVEVRTGKVQRVLKGIGEGFDTIIQDDVRNVIDPSEKIVKLQLSHIHDTRIVETKA